MGSAERVPHEPKYQTGLRHIARRHPEMAEQRDRVLETVAEPESILEGDEGVLMAARLYSATPLTEKFLVVPYRELSGEDGFIVTA